MPLHIFDTRWAIVFLIAVALAVRFAATPLVHRAGYLSEEQEYVAIAERMLAGEGFVDSNGFRSVRAPLYPAMVAFVLSLAGSSLRVLHGLGCIIGAASVGLVSLLAGRIWHDRRTALAAGFAAAFHPGMVIYSTLLETETLYVLFFLVTLLVSTDMLLGRLGRFSGATLGAAAGFASLTRAVFFGFFPVLVMILGVLLRKSPGGCRQLLVAGIVWGAVLAPWVVRNYGLHGSFVPVSSGGGNSFLTGNNPYATGTWRTESGFDEWFNRKAIEQGVVDPSALSENGRSALSGTIAWGYIRENPSDAILLAVKKAHIFWVYPIVHSDSTQLLQAVAVGADFLLMAVALLGISAAWDKRRLLVPILGAILFFCGVQVALHAEARFRLPLVSIFCLFFGNGLSLLSDRNLRLAAFTGRWSRIVFGAGIVVLTGVYAYTAWLFLRGVV